MEIIKHSIVVIVHGLAPRGKGSQRPVDRGILFLKPVPGEPLIFHFSPVENITALGFRIYKHIMPGTDLSYNCRGCDKVGF